MYERRVCPLGPAGHSVPARHGQGPRREPPNPSLAVSGVQRRQLQLLTAGPAGASRPLGLGQGTRPAGWRVSCTRDLSARPGGPAGTSLSWDVSPPGSSPRAVTGDPAADQTLPLVACRGWEFLTLRGSLSPSALGLELPGWGWGGQGPGPRSASLQCPPAGLGGAHRDRRPAESDRGQEHRGEPVADAPAGQRAAGQRPLGQ